MPLVPFIRPLVLAVALLGCEPRISPEHHDFIQRQDPDGGSEVFDGRGGGGPGRQDLCGRHVRRCAKNGRKTGARDRSQGRTVIPGLIDSHMHAIRAALSFSTEVNWIGTRSLAEALDRIRQASHSMAPGAWLIVAGGWNVQQFSENRRPTQAELVAAAPENPVYIQLGYGWAMMTPKALDKLHIATDADLPAGGKLERDSDGKLTGGISGGQNAIIALFDRLPTPTPEQEVEGTKKFFRELNRLGVTGVVDPGGNNMTPESYQALFKVWRQARTDRARGL